MRILKRTGNAAFIIAMLIGIGIEKLENRFFYPLAFAALALLIYAIVIQKFCRNF